LGLDLNCSESRLSTPGLPTGQKPDFAGSG
jgi:hypothetical protein